jgi:hypothetical protein
MFEQNNRMKVHQGEWKRKFSSIEKVLNNAISPNLEIPNSFKFYVPLLKKINCFSIQNPNVSKQIVLAVKLVFVKVFRYYTCSN